MKRIMKFVLAVAACALCACGGLKKSGCGATASDLRSAVESEKSLVAFWDFSENASGAGYPDFRGNFALRDANASVKRVSGDGVFGAACLEFNGENSYLVLPKQEVGALDITKKVTVVAWVKRASGKHNCFVAGLWNEHSDGGKRQYGLFVSLPYYNGADKVCGHISKSGKATAPFPYSVDYSASPEKVEVGKWVQVAMTYDGREIKSYVDGKFTASQPELIEHTKGFAGYPDGLVQRKNPYYFPHGMASNGSDFTVGSVLLKSGMGNFFHGRIAGVAVFNDVVDPSRFVLPSGANK